MFVVYDVLKDYLRHFINVWNLFSLAAILIRTVPDRSPDPKYFLFPGLGPADRKIQNGRQRKQIPCKDIG